MKSFLGALLVAVMLLPTVSFADNVQVQVSRGGLSVEVDRDYEVGRVQRYNEWLRRYNLEVRNCNRYRGHRRADCQLRIQRHRENYERDERGRREQWNREHKRDR